MKEVATVLGICQRNQDTSTLSNLSSSRLDAGTKETKITWLPRSFHESFVQVEDGSRLGSIPVREGQTFPAGGAAETARRELNFASYSDLTSDNYVIRNSRFEKETAASMLKQRDRKAFLKKRNKKSVAWK